MLIMIPLCKFGLSHWSESSHVSDSSVNYDPTFVDSDSHIDQSINMSHVLFVQVYLALLISHRQKVTNGVGFKGEVFKYTNLDSFPQLKQIVNNILWKHLCKSMKKLYKWNNHY